MTISESGLLNFPIGDVLNFYCWLSTIPAPTLDSEGLRTPDSNPTLSLAELAVAIEQMNFTVDCIDCSGPKFEELSDLFDSPSTHAQATHSAQNVMNFMLSLASGEYSFLQTEIDRMLVDAPKFCPHRPEYAPNATRTQYEMGPPPSTDDATFLLALIVAMACVAVGAILVTCAVKLIVSRRHRRWLQSLPSEQVLSVYENQKQRRKIESAANKASQSMVANKRLPLFLRLFVPIVLLGNIALFLSGHLSLGGSVQVYLQIGGQEIVVDDFYTFSIAQSGIELWNAGAKVGQCDRFL